MNAMERQKSRFNGGGASRAGHPADSHLNPPPSRFIVVFPIKEANIFKVSVGVGVVSDGELAELDVSHGRSRRFNFRRKKEIKFSFFFVLFCFGGER